MYKFLAYMKYVHVCLVFARCLQKPEKGTGSLDTGITDSCTQVGPEDWT